MIRHTKVHNKKAKETPLFNCPHCPKTFKRKDNMEAHLITHTKVKIPKETNFECSICSKSFSYQHSLTYHIETQHNKKKIRMEGGFGVFEEIR